MQGCVSLQTDCIWRSEIDTSRGFNFGYSAWINSHFLGSSQGTNQYSADGGQDMANDTWTFDASQLNEGDNVVTVVVDPTGKANPTLGD